MLALRRWGASTSVTGPSPSPSRSRRTPKVCEGFCLSRVKGVTSGLVCRDGSAGSVQPIQWSNHMDRDLTKKPARPPPEQLYASGIFVFSQLSSTGPSGERLPAAQQALRRHSSCKCRLRDAQPTHSPYASLTLTQLDTRHNLTRHHSSWKPQQTTGDHTPNLP